MAASGKAAGASLQRLFQSALSGVGRAATDSRLLFPFFSMSTAPLYKRMLEHCCRDPLLFSHDRQALHVDAEDSGPH